MFLTSAEVANGILPAVQSTFTQAADTAATNVESAIKSLTAAGAKNILAVNLPDFGEIPAAANNPLASFWSDYTTEFNAQFLDPSFLAGLDSSVNLTEFNMFALFNNVIADPSAYGFTNVTDACLPTEGPVPIVPPGACADPNQYLFWDSVHPTAAADQIIGDLFYAAVPEPSSIALLMVPLAVLIGRRQLS